MRAPTDRENLRPTEHWHIDLRACPIRWQVKGGAEDSTTSIFRCRTTCSPRATACPNQPISSSGKPNRWVVAVRRHALQPDFSRRRGRGSSCLARQFRPAPDCRGGGAGFASAPSRYVRATRRFERSSRADRFARRVTRPAGSGAGRKPGQSSGPRSPSRAPAGNWPAEAPDACLRSGLEGNGR